jgi:hypothetical protein
MRKQHGCVIVDLGIWIDLNLFFCFLEYEKGVISLGVGMPPVSLCVYVYICSSLLPERVLFTFGNYELSILGWCPMSKKILAPKISQSQCPLGLRYEPSSPAQTLGSWVRIPLEAWMSLCVCSVFMLFCIGNGLATGRSPVLGVQPSVYGLIKMKKTAKAHKRCRATDR